MNWSGIAASVGFMVLVQVVRLGQEPTFLTARAAEEFPKQIAAEVKSANRAGKREIIREER